MIQSGPYLTRAFRNHIGQIMAVDTQQLAGELNGQLSSTPATHGTLGYPINSSSGLAFFPSYSALSTSSSSSIPQKGKRVSWTPASSLFPIPEGIEENSEEAIVARELELKKANEKKLIQELQQKNIDLENKLKELQLIIEILKTKEEFYKELQKYHAKVYPYMHLGASLAAELTKHKVNLLGWAMPVPIGQTNGTYSNPAILNLEQLYSSQAKMIQAAVEFFRIFMCSEDPFIPLPPHATGTSFMDSATPFQTMPSSSSSSSSIMPGMFSSHGMEVPAMPVYPGMPFMPPAHMMHPIPHMQPQLPVHPSVSNMLPGALPFLPAFHGVYPQSQLYASTTASATGPSPSSSSVISSGSASAFASVFASASSALSAQGSSLAQASLLAQAAVFPSSSQSQQPIPIDLTEDTVEDDPKLLVSLSPHSAGAAEKTGAKQGKKRKKRK